MQQPPDTLRRTRQRGQAAGRGSLSDRADGGAPPLDRQAAAGAGVTGLRVLAGVVARDLLTAVLA